MLTAGYGLIRGLRKLQRKHAVFFATRGGGLTRVKRRRVGKARPPGRESDGRVWRGMCDWVFASSLAQRNARLAELLENASLHLKVVGVIGGAERTLVDAVYLARPVELLLNEVGIVGGHGKKCRRVA